MATRLANRLIKEPRHSGTAACFTASLALALTGCGTTLSAGLDTVKQAWRGGSDSVALTSLNPQYRYLRVQVGDRVGLMVQAGAPSADPSTPSTWFSADGAVLRLLDGRLVGLNDGARSFAWVQPGPAPDWRAVTLAAQPLAQQKIQQTIDLQPGYRLGQTRSRMVKPSAPPPRHRAQDLADGVQWFEESTPGQPKTSTWYAVNLNPNPAQVLYGQTCLEPGWCVSWQPWGAKP